MFNLQSLTMESIDFQSDHFFKELVMCYTGLRSIKKEEAPDSAEASLISKTIKKYSGINLVLDLTSYGPAVEIPKVDKNNVLINNHVRAFINNSKGLDLIKNSNTAIRGSVNRKTGMVDGVFSEIDIALHMPLDLIYDKNYSAEELAGITLHEVGHIYTYFEFMANTVTTNQVLAGISKGLDESSSVKEKEIILMSAKKALNLNDFDSEKLAKVNDKKVVEIVVISSVLREASSEIGTNVYDLNTWEYLSDQYATRMGAGKHLVTALDKIYRSQWNISTRNIVVYLSLEAMKLIVGFVNPALTILLIAIDGSGDGTYDRPGARLKRIRNQLIERLKDKKLSKDDVILVNDDIKMIDEILESIEDRRQLFGLLWDTLVPSARRAYKQEKLQQQLEVFAGNELFKQAADVKQLLNTDQ